jgi:hypothetical protein
MMEIITKYKGLTENDRGLTENDRGLTGNDRDDREIENYN